MKKIISFCLLMCSILLFSGCFGKIPEEDTISLDKKGRVTSTIVEDFDKEFYDAEELEGEIDEELAKYNQNFAADHIRKEAFQVEDGVASLQLVFDECKYYSDYTGLTLFAGTVSEAEEEGYDLQLYGEYMDADGSLTDVDTVSAEGDVSVLILEEAVKVQVPGKILAVSPTDYVTITGSREASVQEAGLSYIIYK